MSDISKKILNYEKIAVFYIVLGVVMLMVPFSSCIYSLLNPNKIVALELFKSELIESDHKAFRNKQELKGLSPRTKLENTLIENNIFYIESLGVLYKGTIMFVYATVLKILAMFGGVILGIGLIFRKFIVYLKKSCSITEK